MVIPLARLEEPKVTFFRRPWAAYQSTICGVFLMSFATSRRVRTGSRPAAEGAGRLFVCYAVIGFQHG